MPVVRRLIGRLKRDVVDSGNRTNRQLCPAGIDANHASRRVLQGEISPVRVDRGSDLPSMIAGAPGHRVSHREVTHGFLSKRASFNNPQR